MKLSGFYSAPTTTPYASVFGVKAPAVDAVKPTEKAGYVPLNNQPLLDSFQRQSTHFSPTSLGAQFNQFKLMARKRRQSSEPVSITYGFQQQDDNLGLAKNAAVRVLHRKKGDKAHFVADVVSYDPVDFSQNLTLGSGMRKQLPRLEENRVPQSANAYQFNETGRIALAKELNVETQHRPVAQRIVDGLRKATEFFKPLKQVVSVKPDNTVTLMGKQFNPVDVHTDVESGQRVQPMRLMRYGEQVIQVQSLGEKGLTGKVFSSAKDALNQLTQWTAQLEQRFGFERNDEKTRLYQGPESAVARKSKAVKPVASKATKPGKPLASLETNVQPAVTFDQPKIQAPLGGMSVSGFNSDALKRLSAVPNPFASIQVNDVAQGVEKILELNKQASQK